MKTASKEKIIRCLKTSVKVYNRYIRFRLRIDISFRADLSYADLSYAELSYTDLRSADLRYADLSSADLDFSCWPLWCGSLKVKMTSKIFCQLLYHAAKPEYSENDPDIKKLLNLKTFKAVCNKFHRVDECGNIK